MQYHRGVDLEYLIYGYILDKAPLYILNRVADPPSSRASAPLAATFTVRRAWRMAGDGQDAWVTDCELH